MQKLKEGEQVAIERRTGPASTGAALLSIQENYMRIINAR